MPSMGMPRHRHPVLKTLVDKENYKEGQVALSVQPICTHSARHLGQAGTESC